MKLWARTAAALLAAVMLLAACACGGTSTTSSQGNPSNPSAPASNPSTPASTQDVELIMDLGGYEFTWATIWSWANYPEPGATEYGDRRLESYEKIEKQYNCSIESTTLNAVTFSTELGEAIAAGSKYYDFFQVDYSRYMNIREDLMPLNQLEGLHISDPKYIASSTAMYTGEDGNVYGLCYDYQKAPYGYILAYNKTLLDTYNQPDPYDLVKSNNWTFDTFADICRALTKPASGQYGFSGVDWNSLSVEIPFIFANGGREIKKDSNGLWKFAMLDSDTQNALNYLHQLIYVDKTFVGSSGSDLYAGFNEFCKGNAGFFICTLEYIYGFDSETSKLKEGMEWGIVPIPMGPDAGGVYQNMDAGGLAWCMMKVNPCGDKNSPDYNKAAIIFDAIANPVYETVERDHDAFFKMFKTTKLTNSDKKLEMLLLCADSTVFNEGWGVPGMPETVSAAIDECVRGTEYTPKAAMETISGTAQWYIDAYFYGVEDEEPPVS